MSKKDIPRVMEIERESFDFPWPESFFEEQIGMGGLGSSLVAVRGALILGYIVLWFEGGGSHILNLAVDPAWRGRNISGVILEEALRVSAEKGCRSVYLEVRKGNSRAVEFYKKHGFEIRGEIKGYYRENGEDALILIIGLRS